MNFFFSDWQSLLRILIITVCAYITLVVILRLSGKRTLSKMNAFDLVVTVALGSTLSSVIINKSVKLAEGMLAFLLLVLLQLVVTWMSVRSKKFSQVVKASPTLVAYKGALNWHSMRMERISEDDIYAVLRQNRISTLAEADAVILETDGTLTVLPEIRDEHSEVITSLKKPG